MIIDEGSVKLHKRLKISNIAGFEAGNLEQDKIQIIERDED